MAINGLTEYQPPGPGLNLVPKDIRFIKACLYAGFPVELIAEQFDLHPELVEKIRAGRLFSWEPAATVMPVANDIKPRIPPNRAVLAVRHFVDLIKRFQAD